MLLELVILNSVSAVVGLSTAAYLVRRTGRWLNLSTQLLLNFSITEPLSAVAHLLMVPGASRGYVDAVQTPIANEQASVLVLGLALTVSVISLASTRRSTADTGPTDHRWGAGAGAWNIDAAETRRITIVVVCLAPVAVFATLVIQSFAASIDSSRIISLTDGLARYSYISNWLVWVVSLTAILLSKFRWSAGPARSAVIVGGSALVIFGALSWSGSRSVALLMVTPLVMIFGKRLYPARIVLVPLALACIGLYSAAVSATRNASGQGPWIDLITYLDWQWGRYSMSAWALNVIQSHGLYLGETFAQGFLSVITGAFRLLGVNVPVSSLTSSNLVASQYILGTSDIYIVPGLSSELILNFGAFGALIGFAVLAALVGRLDLAFVRARSPISKLLAAYIGCVLVYRTMQSDSSSIWVYPLYAGFPLLLLAVLSLLGRRSRVHRAGEVA